MNKKKNNNKRPQEVKPLTDSELIRLGLRSPEIKLDENRFTKSDAEKAKLKEEKKKHKKFLANSEQ